MKYLLQVEQAFDSAHFLVDSKTKCDNCHGHRWLVKVTVLSDKLDKNGFVINFTILKTWLRTLCSTLDHNLLNKFFKVTTAEKIAAFFAYELDLVLCEYCLDNDVDVNVDSIEVYETPTSKCTLKIEGKEDLKTIAGIVEMNKQDKDEATVIVEAIHALGTRR